MTYYFQILRCVCVKIRGSASKHAVITCRVPVGSILGLLLFLVYNNNIHKSDSKTSFCLYADNTSLSFANKNIRRLKAKVNTSLENLTNRLKPNKLILNAENHNFYFLACHRGQNNSWSMDMTGQNLPFLHPEFSVVIEMADHFSLEQLEKFVRDTLKALEKVQTTFKRMALFAFA